MQYEPLSIPENLFRVPLCQDRESFEGVVVESFLVTTVGKNIPNLLFLEPAELGEWETGGFAFIRNDDACAWQ